VFVNIDLLALDIHAVKPNLRERGTIHPRNKERQPELNARTAKRAMREAKNHLSRKLPLFNSLPPCKELISLKKTKPL
jgi:hypothetical protein